MKSQTILLAIIITALTSACCTDNRKSKEAALQASLVLQAEAEYVIANNLIDPIKLATSPDGTFDKEACIEHSKMLELFLQETPALAAALEAWANEKDVEEFVPTEANYEARCNP